MMGEAGRLLGGVAQSEFFREAAEVGFFGGVENGEFLGDAGCDFGKQVGDKGASARAEADGDEAQIFGLAHAFDEAGFFEVGDDEGEVGGAFEEFGGELVLAKRTEVKQNFEYAKLGDGQIGGQRFMYAGRHGFGGPEELVVRIEGSDLVGWPLMVCRHGAINSEVV